MNQNKPAPSAVNIKKTLFFIALATASTVLLLKVIKETIRVPEPVPLTSPLPDSATLAEDTAQSEQPTDKANSD